ncbi:cysteine peptidase family C39 domain-containing protein [Phormidesmis sp. 146-33]
MIIEAIATLLLGALCFRWGMKVGRVLLRQGSTANDLFRGKNTNPMGSEATALLFLGLYVGLILLALNIPQMQVFPLTWRVYGMQVTWTAMRVILLGFCGVAFAIVWSSARKQVFAILLLGLIGITGFTATEAYFLAPIYTDLSNNLQPNGVFRQTSMSSCAPAALATILHRWGIPEATEVSVAEQARTSQMGTTMPQLIVAARHFRMDGVELAPTWEQMRQINRPGVLGVWLIDGRRKLPHAIALLSMNQNQAAIGDPASGKIFVLDRTQFAKIWREQYVPIFRRNEDLSITTTQAIDYLKRLGYSSQTFKSALQDFQKTMGIEPTGNLDTQTKLLLTGSFLKGVPTLKDLDLSNPT